MKQARFKSMHLEMLSSGGQHWVPGTPENPRCCSGLAPRLLDQNRLLFCKMNRVLHFEWRRLLRTATSKDMGLKIWLDILGPNPCLPGWPLPRTHHPLLPVSSIHQDCKPTSPFAVQASRISLGRVFFCIPDGGVYVCPWASPRTGPVQKERCTFLPEMHTLISLFF